MHMVHSPSWKLLVDNGDIDDDAGVVNRFNS